MQGSIVIAVLFVRAILALAAFKLAADGATFAAFAAVRLLVPGGFAIAM